MKKAAKAFWKFLLELMNGIGCQRSKVDNCVYYKWDNSGLSILASWVDDLIVNGGEDTVVAIDDCGEMDEYVACKVDINKDERELKFTQPVMIQNFEDKFNLK